MRGPTRIGFVGFGEVAAIFSQALCEKGADVSAYDVLLDRPDGRDQVAARRRSDAIQLRGLGELIESADYVLSTVTTQVARDAARRCAALLRPGQTFVDLNSTSPGVKQELAAIIEPSGAAFVEGAILGAVGATGSRTRILTGGARGAETAEVLTKFGLVVSFYSPTIGQASTFKMLRGIFSKGLEALLLEMLVAGRRAGIDKDLWKEALDSVGAGSFERVASNWIQTHVVAYERRYHEMGQVVETMRELGVDPVLTDATRAFFERSRTLGLGEAFPEKPASVDAVVDFFEKRLRNV